MVVLNVRAHIEHARTHRSSRVFRASEKESAPVARQPQPPRSLAHLRLRDTKDTGINCGSSLCPL